MLNRGLAGVTWSPGSEKLTVGDCFSKPVEITTFPQMLRELSFGDVISYPLQGVTLPDLLTRLPFGRNYPVSHLLQMDWSQCSTQLVPGW